MSLYSLNVQQNFCIKPSGLHVNVSFEMTFWTELSLGRGWILCTEFQSARRKCQRTNDPSWHKPQHFLKWWTFFCVQNIKFSEKESRQNTLGRWSQLWILRIRCIKTKTELSRQSFLLKLKVFSENGCIAKGMKIVCGIHNHTWWL